MAIAGADCTFISADDGVFGRESDSSVFRNSAFLEALLNDACHKCSRLRVQIPDCDNASPL
jgi:hypothetical protein